MAKPRSNDEWIYWGKHDPLFAVSAVRGKEIGARGRWNPEEFLETGRLYFTDVYLQWQQYGVGIEHCAEIGCGSGRITKQLVSHFSRVTAVDVAPGQLDTAQRLLGADADRVTLGLVSEPILPLEHDSCDGVFSCEVFQHFDDDRGLQAYIREAHRVLTPGGTLCFQVPLVGVQPRFFLSSLPRTWLLRVLRKLGRRRMMIYRRYRAEAVFAMLIQAGFRQPELRVFHANQQDGFHCYFFGRKQRM